MSDDEDEGFAAALEASLETALIESTGREAFEAANVHATGAAAASASAPPPAPASDADEEALALGLRLSAATALAAPAHGSADERLDAEALAMALHLSAVEASRAAPLPPAHSPDASGEWGGEAEEVEVDEEAEALAWCLHESEREVGILGLIGGAAGGGGRGGSAAPRAHVPAAGPAGGGLRPSASVVRGQGGRGGGSRGGALGMVHGGGPGGGYTASSLPSRGGGATTAVGRRGGRGRGGAAAGNRAAAGGGDGNNLDAEEAAQLQRALAESAAEIQPAQRPSIPLGWCQVSAARDCAMQEGGRRGSCACCSILVGVCAPPPVLNPHHPHAHVCAAQDCH